MITSEDLKNATVRVNASSNHMMEMNLYSPISVLIDAIITVKGSKRGLADEKIKTFVELTEKNYEENSEETGNPTEKFWELTTKLSNDLFSEGMN